MQFEEARDFARHITGVIVAVGGVDTGKTTWIRKALEAHPSTPLGLISADLGQGILGPPAMFGGQHYERSQSFQETIQPEKLVFVGQTNPAGKFVEALLGLNRLINYFRAFCPVVFVDTDGLIHGTVGRTYKSALIEIARPCSVFLFGGADEVSGYKGIWSKWSDVIVYHVEPHEKVQRRTSTERFEARQKKYAEWFRNSAVIELSLHDLTILSSKTGLGRVLPEQEIQAIQKELAVPIYRIEVTGREVYCIIERDAELSIVHALRKHFPDAYIHLESIYNWRNRLIGGINHEGWTVAFGRVRGWSYAQRSIEIELGGDPVAVAYWVLGEGRYPETLHSTGLE